MKLQTLREKELTQEFELGPVWQEPTPSKYIHINVMLFQSEIPYVQYGGGGGLVTKSWWLLGHHGL